MLLRVMKARVAFSLFFRTNRQTAKKVIASRLCRVAGLRPLSKRNRESASPSLQSQALVVELALLAMQVAIWTVLKIENDSSLRFNFKSVEFH